MLTTTAHFETLTEFSTEELQELLDRTAQELNARNSDTQEETVVEIGHEEELSVEMNETLTTENEEIVAELNDEMDSSEVTDELDTETALSTEMTIEEMPVDSTEPIGETSAKNDIEIRIDEIYSIRVVANEVVNGIEELQAEVKTLHVKVNNLVSSEELEHKVKEMVASALRERFM